MLDFLIQLFMFMEELLYVNVIHIPLSQYCCFVCVSQKIQSRTVSKVHLVDGFLTFKTLCLGLAMAKM